VVNNGNKNKHIEQMCRNKKLFLEKYPECRTVRNTLDAIGIKTRSTFYHWCEQDPKFKKIYLTELLPNKRDKFVKMLEDIALGEVKANNTQLTAIFGMLKASDHIDTGPDRLIFVERHQLTGADGGPIEVEHDAKGKLARLLDSFAARAGKTEGTGKSESKGG